MGQEGGNNGETGKGRKGSEERKKGEGKGGRKGEHFQPLALLTNNRDQLLGRGGREGGRVGREEGEKEEGLEERKRGRKGWKRGGEGGRMIKVEYRSEYQ